MHTRSSTVSASASSSSSSYAAVSCPSTGGSATAETSRLVLMHESFPGQHLAWMVLMWHNASRAYPQYEIIRGHANQGDHLFVNDALKWKAIDLQDLITGLIGWGGEGEKGKARNGDK